MKSIHINYSILPIFKGLNLFPSSPTSLKSHSPQVKINLFDKYFFLINFCLLSLLPAAPIQISGQVKSEIGGIIKGATVILKGYNLSSTTNENGNYKISAEITPTSPTVYVPTSPITFSKGQLQIHLNSGESLVEVVLLNLQGKVVSSYTKSFLAGDHLIPVTTQLVPEGIYYLRVKMGMEQLWQATFLNFSKTKSTSAWNNLYKSSAVKDSLVVSAAGFSTKSLGVDSLVSVMNISLKPLANLCAVNPCLNGGTCNTSLPGFTCNCPSGYGGEFCEGTISATQDNFGFNGYMGYSTGNRQPGYDMGIGFYTSVWSLIKRPLINFQIGLPGIWIQPNNEDNFTTPLCPIGTLARNWSERGPTYSTVFQTIEGGMGYWVTSRYPYGQPKYRVNSITQCYDFEVSSPGFSFYMDPLTENQLSLAQLSNRLLLAPDGLTFETTPSDALLGYSWMALPLTPSRDQGQPTGENSWTLFINTSNFKGPVAYMIPQAFSRNAKTLNYPFNYGRGLDSRPGLMDGGAMEFGAVPRFSETIAGTIYSKIPQLHFPTNTLGQAVLVRDFRVYSKEALYNSVKAWREGGANISGRFASKGEFLTKFTANSPGFAQGGLPIQNLTQFFKSTTFDENSWGLEWQTQNSVGKFPRYFKQVGSTVTPILESELPSSAQIKTKEFPEVLAPPVYQVNLSNVWTNPGPVGPDQKVVLLDGTQLTYRWYKFIDQPVFAQVGYTEEEKNKLQSLIEKIHTHWKIDSEYMTPPQKGSLTTLDPALLVTPPKGYEVGYVPIVIRQEVPQKPLSAIEIMGKYEHTPKENEWHSVEIVEVGGNLVWKNAAGVQWSLQLNNGKLTSGPDCPYGVKEISPIYGSKKEITGLLFESTAYMKKL